jgi:hypothetical protein
VNARITVRALVLVTLAITLGAPTPGHIGGCDTSPPEVDPYEFCVQKETLACERDGHSSPPRKTAEQVAECNASIADDCFGFQFAVCEPTRAQADACLDALASIANLQRETQSFAECDFCAESP